MLDTENGILAVADGLGGLPNGARASKLALEVLRKKLIQGKDRPLIEIVSEVNQETREVGFQMDESGFGTTLTFCRLTPDGSHIEIAHVDIAPKGGAVDQDHAGSRNVSHHPAFLGDMHRILGLNVANQYAANDCIADIK